MMKTASCALLATGLLAPAFANTSATVTAATDHMFLGISQTENNPTLQASLDYQGDNGMYVGAWAANVDYGEDGQLEIDGYLGHRVALSASLNVDYGITYFSYHRGSTSSDINYPEVFSYFAYAWGGGETELNLWYAWDYSGTGARHTIVEIAHNWPLSEQQRLRLSADSSTSLDGDKYTWEGADTSYQHVRLAWLSHWQGFNIEVAAETTNLNSYLADERVVAAISRTFAW